MPRPASQRTVYLILIMLTAACSKVSISKISSGTTRLESDSAPLDGEETQSTETEKVSPPNNISDSYLVCDVQNNADPVVPEAAVLCVLRDDKTQNKVDLVASFQSHEWKSTIPDLTGITSTSREMPADSLWHWEIQIKAASPIQRDQAVRGTRVSLSVQKRDGQNETIKDQAVTAVQSVAFWSLNGNPLPAHAIPGGTQRMGMDILSICRVHSAGGVYPGKMKPHYLNPEKTICYSTKDNSTIASLGDDGSTVLLSSDALLSGTRPWADEVEWSSFSAGMPFPKNAFVGGRDDLGETLYVCRGSEAGPPPSPTDQPNDPAGEWTPGYVKISNGICQHEYHGQRSNVNYQVLVWKTAP
ncbi:MAG: DUF3421 domain-containing protein [Pseudobdellovibrionaceae bacterium]|nr:DUF3421 domain-containing protein [Pseudobdellovibrionaceae bacterium]